MTHVSFTQKAKHKALQYINTSLYQYMAKHKALQYINISVHQYMTTSPEVPWTTALPYKYASARQ